MIVLIITNIILAVVFGLNAILCLLDDEEEAKEAKRNYTEYKGLYENALERHKEADYRRRETEGIERRNSELVLRVGELEGELSSCEDRIESMAKENDELKKKIKALSKSAKKGKNESVNK